MQENLCNCPNIKIFFKTPEEMASFVYALNDYDILAGEKVYACNMDEMFYNRMLYSLPGDARDEIRPIPVFKEE